MTASDRSTPCVLALALALACANPPTGELGSRRGSAVLRDASGRTVGEVELRERPGFVEVRADLHDLDDGRFALALGPRGECEAHFAASPFASAGPPSPLGTRAPPPFDVARGGGSVTVRAEGVSVSGGPAPLLDWDGSALLLRRAGDDGAPPVACGVVRR